MTEINKDEIAVVGVRIDENGNPIVSVNPSTNESLTVQQIEESKSIWSKLFEIFTYKNDLFEVFRKTEEVKIVYNTRYNDRIQENIDNGVAAENIHLDAVLGTVGDYIEKEGTTSALNKIYEVDTDMPAANILGEIMSYHINEISDGVDESNIVADTLREVFVDKNSDSTSNNSQLWISDEGHVFLLDEDQKMTIKLTSDLQDASKKTEIISSALEDEREISKIVLEKTESSQESNESYEISQGDQKQLIEILGISPDNATFIDAEGNVIATDDAIFVKTDSAGNKITVKKEGAKINTKDGGSHAINSVVNQADSQVQNIAKFAADQTKEFTDGFQDYLVQSKERILADFIARMTLGQSAEEAIKAVVEVWSVNAVFNNQYTDGLFSDMFGIKPIPVLDENGNMIGGIDYSGNGLAPGEYAIDPNTNQVLVDANGEPVTFRSDQGDITHNEAMGGVKAGVVSFLTTVLIAELRGGGMDSEQYSEAAIKAAGVGVMTAMLPSGTPVGALMAIIDSSIVAFEERGDFNSEDWQDLTTHTAAAVAAAVIGWKIGATIGTAIGGPIGTVVGGVIGAVVGALLYVPLKNLFDTQFEASEELYDAIEDTLIKMDWSANNVEENAKQAIKAVEDIAKAYLIDLPLDYYTGLFNLLSGGSFYSGQTFGPGEYGDPSLITRQLYEIRQKADGTGLEIIGVGREGVTLKASQNGVDDIYGSAHSDVMVGNDQNNIIIGSSSSENGADNDMIEGKGGDDVLLGNAGHDHIDGGDGDDQIDGGVGNDRLIAGAGDDIVIGDEGDDIIEGNEGNDQIDSGAGDDIVDGGSGDDTIVSGTGHDQIDSGDGKDIIFSESGDDLIRAGAGDDNIDSGEGNDEVYGQDGEDNINTGLGNDIVFAGAGVDTVNAGLGNDIVDAGQDDDLVLAGLGNDIVYGNSGNDDLYGEIGNDYIMGGTGDDEIGGGEGDDILIGNIGNDKLNGGSGNDLFIHNLGDGNTEIKDESGSDIIRVFGVADQNNISFAKNGNDLEITFSDNASDKITIKDQFLDSDPRIESIRIDNNTEIDLTSLIFDAQQNATYNTSYYSDAIDESELAEKYQTILEDSNNEVVYNSYSSWYTDNYDTNVLTQEIDYEQYNEVQIRSYKAKRGAFGGHYMVYYKYYESNLGGTFGNDKIVGSWWNENIFGGDGNDYLYGNDGDDTIFGGDDHDLIYLGSGNDAGYGQNGFDKIYGGEGNDTIEGNNDNDTLYGEAGNDVIMGRSGDDLAFGGKGNDFLKGGSGHDILFGGDHSDNIEGESGNDYLLGEDGDDIISGGDGHDIIIGGDGNDIINGNDGHDNIKGGNGLDIIDGGTGNDTIDAGAGNDMIIDSSGDDKITLGDGQDIFMIDTTNGGTKTITDFNKDEDRIVLKDVTSNFATLLVNANLLQEGNNVRFTYNSYNLILENTQISDLDADNFITSIVGDELDNILNGDEYANAIFGLDGNDILNGNGGDDLLWGGNGSDILNGNAGDDILYYNIDSYWQGSRASTGKWSVINRTPSVINQETRDVVDIEGNTASQDLFDGGDGDDILIMSEESDVISLDSVINQVDNLLFGRFNAGTTYERNDDNNYQGTAVDIETIYAFAGDDVINLYSNTHIYGDVRVYGDSGNDTIWTSHGNDVIFGGDGSDDIRTSDGDDIVYGGSENDTIHGGEGNDELYGGSGNDTLIAGDSYFETLTSSSGLEGNRFWDHEYNSEQLIADFNGDGLDDVVNLQRDGNHWISLSNGDGTFNYITDPAGLETRGFTGNENNSEQLIGDFNGDGFDDIINLQSNGDHWLSLSRGNGMFNHYSAPAGIDPVTVTRGFTGNQNISKQLIGDFDGDGKDDIINLQSNGDHWMAIGAGNRFHYRSAPEGLEGKGFWGDENNSEQLIADLNGDGFDDIVNLQSNGDHWISLSNGDWTFSHYSAPGGIEAAGITRGFYGHEDSSEQLVGDFNGDGLEDIVNLQHDGNHWLAISAGNRFHFYSSPDGLEGNSFWNREHSSEQLVADVNGDGLDDIINLQRDGNNWVSLSNGDGTFRYLDDPVGLEGNSFWAYDDNSEQLIADFNGDGLDDVVNLQADGNHWISLSSFEKENQNILDGGDGNDNLQGSIGDDSIKGGFGKDIMSGGLGNDSFDYSSLEESSINAMDEIEDFDQGEDKINLSQIEEDLSFDSLEFVVENGHTIIKDKNSDFAINLTGELNLNEDDFLF